jgi:asparagine synthase (glutamine-hydrolysing)
VLARDRFGIKPLYIYQSDDLVAFASELGALRPWVQFEPDLRSISSFLLGFSGPTKGQTFARSVSMLPPGSVIKFNRQCEPVHDIFGCLIDLYDEEQRIALHRLSDSLLLERIDELLHASVRSQLFADAPVGAFCSGGIDSSIILAIAAKYHDDLAAFHANVVGRLSEYDAATAMARYLRLELRSVDIDDHDFINYIPEVIEHYGHPFHSTLHCVPLMLVSRLARSTNVKALLSGEGADECFLGYDWIIPTSRRRLRYLRRHGVGPIRTVLGASMARSRYWGPPNVGGAQSDHHAELVTALHNRFEVAGESHEIRRRVFAVGTSAEHLAVAQSLDLLHYNLRALLHRNDSMGMAASIEARFPFLDTKLVTASINLPRRCKIRFGPAFFDREHPFYVDKWILRKIARRYLPKEVSHRPKRPFPVDAYAPARLQIDDEFFDQSGIRDLFSLSLVDVRHLVEKAKHELKFKLLQLDVWVDVFLKNTSNDAVRARLNKHVRVRPAADMPLLRRILQQ